MRVEYHKVMPVLSQKVVPQQTRCSQKVKPVEKWDADGYATGEENCFGTPPLKQEREVLDKYFTDLTTKTLNKGEGWSQINDLPSLWQK